MTTTTGPQTYNDDRLNEKSREVFFKAITAAERMVDGTDTMNTEKLHALATLADAAACGFKDENDEDEAF